MEGIALVLVSLIPLALALCCLAPLAALAIFPAITKITKRWKAEEENIAIEASTEKEEFMKEQITLKVPTIHCDGCIDGIRLGFRRLKGVSFVAGDPDNKTITLSYDPDHVSLDSIKGAVEKAGHLVEG